MFELADLPAVTDVRGYGLLAAFDLAPDGAPGARGLRCLKRLFDEGLLIKWTGDTGIVAPPLIAEPEHIDEIARLLRRVLAAPIGASRPAPATAPSLGRVSAVARRRHRLAVVDVVADVADLDHRRRPARAATHVAWK